MPILVSLLIKFNMSLSQAVSAPFPSYLLFLVVIKYLDNMRIPILSMPSPLSGPVIFLCLLILSEWLIQ